MAITDPDIDEAIRRNFGPEPTPLQKVGKAVGSALSPVGKILDVLDTGLNITASVAGRTVFGDIPAVQELIDNAPKKMGVPNVMFSDIFEAAFPKGDKVTNAVRAVAGFAFDVAGDPLSYVTLGGLTKAGKVTKNVQGLVREGRKISGTSDIGMAAKEIVGGSLAEARKLTLGESLAEQAAKKQRALISFGIPFGEEKPIIYGSKIFNQIDKINAALRKNKYTNAFNRLFSTSSGNPELDRLRDEFITLGRHITGEAKLDASDFAKRMNAIVEVTGETEDVIKRDLIDLVENPMHGSILAASVKAINQGDLAKKLYENQEEFETVFKNMHGISSLNHDQQGLLFRDMWRELVSLQAFGNPFTIGLRQLPHELRIQFADLFTRQAGLHVLSQSTARAAKLNGVLVAQLGGNKPNVRGSFGSVLTAYTKGLHLDGKKLTREDSALLAFVGKKEYKRLKEIEKRASQINPLLPAHVQTSAGIANEATQTRNTIKKLLAHVDESYALNYTMYKANPTLLKKLNPQAHALIEKVFSNDAWKIEPLIEQFHLPHRIAAKFPKLLDLAQDIRAWMQSTLKAEENAGVKTREFIGDIHYIPHIPTLEMRKFLQENLGDRFNGAAKQWTAEHSNQLMRSLTNIDSRKVEEAFNLGLLTNRQRKAILGKNGLKYLEENFSRDFATRLVHTLTRSEVDTIAKNGKLKLLNGREVDKFFDDNPVELIRIRGAKAGRAISSAQFFEAAKQFGKWVRGDSPLAPEGFQFVGAPQLAGVKKIVDPVTGESVLHRLAFEPEVARWIDKYYETISLPRDAHPFLEFYDKWTDEFKAWTLSIFPAYHLRNIFGNLWNNNLAGMDPVSESRWYWNAKKIQRGEKFSMVTKAGEKLNHVEIMEAAKRWGIFNGGAFTGDIEHWFEQEARRGIYRKGIRVPADIGISVGNYFENNAKLAHFMWQIEKGASFQDAALSVKKYLFDYRDLTDTERALLRRTMPFYTWSRKNIPLQLEALLAHPGRPLGVLKAKNAFETNYDGVPDERFLPDWMIQNFPIRWRKNAQGNSEYFLLGSWLPLADIDKIFDPVRYSLNMLSPILKEPMQQVANKDFFFDREIDQGDEYERIWNINAPKRVTHLARNIRLINEVDKIGFKDDTDAFGKIMRGLTGKSYPYDEEKERDFKRKAFRDKERNLKMQLKRAIRKEDKGEEDRVRRRIDKLFQEEADSF